MNTKRTVSHKHCTVHISISVKVVINHFITEGMSEDYRSKSGCPKKFSVLLNNDIHDHSM